MLWDLSCRDWETRIRTGQSLVPKLPLFETEAEIAVRFFNSLRLSNVTDRPPLRDAAGEWYRDIVRAVFGSRDPTTNHRFIREVFALVGKGNSKTAYSAGLMLVALLMNVRPRAEFLFIAPTQTIADAAFGHAVGMIELDPELVKRFHVRDHKKEIVDRVTKAKLKIKSFDLKILTGSGLAGVLLDEIHLLGRNPSTQKVLRQVRGGIEKTAEGFFIMITTQSDEQPKGAFDDELKAARAIRDGNRTGRMLPILYEFPKDIATDPTKWKDPANWWMVMPNLGRSLDLESLKQDFLTEEAKGPHTTQIWASQHLNIEIGVGIRNDGWRGAKHWDRVVDRTLTLEELIRRCEPRSVVVGIDGGGLDDLTGLAVLGREKGTRRWLLWNHAWCHRSVLEDRKEIAPSLLMFEKDGDLTFIDDDTDTDRVRIADIVELLDASGALADNEAIGIDPAATSLIADELILRGFPVTQEDAPGRVIGVRQGAMSMNGLIRTVELRLAASKVVHAGSRLMNWCAGNAVTVQHGNATAIEKAASHNAKIDPLMATFNAAAVIQKVPEQIAEYQAFLAG